MPGSIRFHLDEHVPHAIAAGLRRYGVDVTVTSDVGLLHATDDVHLAFTRDTTRVMVTHDEDFLVLHSQGMPHAGMVSDQNIHTHHFTRDYPPSSAIPSPLVTIFERTMSPGL